jgi:hypothetical protein
MSESNEDSGNTFAGLQNKRQVPPGMAYEGDRELIPVWQSPEPPLSVQLLDDLLENGASIPDIDKAIGAIESAFDRAGDERAAEALHRIIGQLGENSTAGIELKRIICQLGKGKMQPKLSPQDKVARWVKRHFAKACPVNTKREQFPV